jgi:hypothetical protein
MPPVASENNLEGGKGEVPVLAAEKRKFMCHKGSWFVEVPTLEMKGPQVYSVYTLFSTFSQDSLLFF